MIRLSAYLKKDGWILVAIIFCATLCLMLSMQEERASEGEERISRILSTINGAGNVDVAVYYENSTPCGAVIVADGAADVLVQLRLTSAVSTLLGIEQTRIAIYDRRED